MTHRNSASSDSLKSSAPLRRTVARYITRQTLQAVARAGREEHRRLYAGTVNYDTGKLVIWDLTAIAMDHTNRHRLELYRQVVLASASIPIVVPPVNIDGNLYADGGARAQLFFEKGFLPGLREISHTNLTLYVIVNGKLGMETNCVSDCLKALTLRTLDMLLDANAIGNLYHIKSELDRTGSVNFDFPASRRTFQSQAPPNLCPAPCKPSTTRDINFADPANRNARSPSVSILGWMGVHGPAAEGFALLVSELMAA
jgi:hypothetical protein